MSVTVYMCVATMLHLAILATLSAITSLFDNNVTNRPNGTSLDDRISCFDRYPHNLNDQQMLCVLRCEY